MVIVMGTVPFVCFSHTSFPSKCQGVLSYMLLVSSLPFYGRDRDSIVKKIFRNKPSFREKRWKKVSPEAKRFIQSLLVSDPENRADAETALKADWFQTQAMATIGGDSTHSGIEITQEQQTLVRESILRYAKYPKLKKMVRCGCFGFGIAMTAQ